MQATIHNEFLTLTVDTHGAEAVSLKNAAGEEMLWQADPAVWGRDRDGIEQARQSVCGKADVQHRPNDLDHGALVRLAHCKNPLDLVPPTAPEPAEISVISCVMALCRARL